MAVNFTDSSYIFTPGVAGVTTTRTSPAQDVSKRDAVTLIFTSSNITSGNGVFTVDASNDGSYWATGIAFRSAGLTGAAAVSQTYGSVTSTTNRNWAAVVEKGWSYIRVKVTVTTDGRYNCVLHSQG